MRTVAKQITLAALAMALGACVTKSDFEALRLDYDNLKEELREWAYDPGPDGNVALGMLPPWISVREWQDWTKIVICDIWEKNPAPSTDPYDPETDEYCGTSDPNGTPEDPPPFGL